MAIRGDATCVYSATRIACFGPDIDASGKLLDLDAGVGTIAEVALGDGAICVKGTLKTRCYSLAAAAWTDRALPAPPASKCTLSPASDAARLVVCPGFPAHAQRVTIAKAKRVAVGESHACAVRTDGTVACWGSGTFGEIGAPPHSVTDGMGVVEVPDIADAVDVGVGRFHSCALRRGGVVACWGGASASLFPGAVRHEPRVVRILSPDSGTSNELLVALDATGAVYRMPMFEGFRKVALPARAAEISQTDDVGCARLEDGSIHCFTHSGAPYPIALPRPAAALIDGSECAILQGGDIACWGASPTAIVQKTSAPPVRSFDIARDAGADLVRCFLLQNGRVECTGVLRYDWKYYSTPPPWGGNFIPAWGTVPAPRRTAQALAASEKLVEGNREGCFRGESGAVYQLADSCRGVHCALELVRVPGVAGATRVVPGDACVVERAGRTAARIDIAPQPYPDTPSRFVPTRFTVAALPPGVPRRVAKGCVVFDDGSLACGTATPSLPPIDDYAATFMRCVAPGSGGLRCWSDQGSGTPALCDAIEGHVPEALFGVGAR